MLVLRVIMDNGTRHEWCVGNALNDDVIAFAKRTKEETNAATAFVYEEESGKVVFTMSAN